MLFQSDTDVSYKNMFNMAVQYPGVFLSCCVGFMGLMAGMWRAVIAFVSAVSIWQILAYEVICVGSRLVANLTVILFATVYMLFPPFLNGREQNWFVVSFFSMYVIAAFFGSHGETPVGSLIIKCLLSILVACLYVYFVWSLAPQVFFVKETNGNGDVCTMATNQQFKCTVYKNGELVT